MPVDCPSTDAACPLGQKECGRPKAQRRSRPWHRVLGLLAALPLLWVVITGAVLNHTVDWKLDRIMIESPLVLGLYGMQPEGQPRGQVLGEWQVAEWAGLIFVNGRVRDVRGALLGAVVDDGGLAVVTDEQVLRLDRDGETLELMTGVSLPPLPLTGVHQQDGDIFLANAEGWHRVDAGWLDFNEVSEVYDFKGLTVWDDAAKRRELSLAWSEGGLPLSRILLDLHAGRFLGPVAKYFYDVVALATIWLCVTGLILFFRKSRRRVES